MCSHQEQTLKSPFRYTVVHTQIEMIKRSRKKNNNNAQNSWLVKLEQSLLGPTKMTLPKRLRA